MRAASSAQRECARELPGFPMPYCRRSREPPARPSACNDLFASDQFPWHAFLPLDSFQERFGSSSTSSSLHAMKLPSRVWTIRLGRSQKSRTFSVSNADHQYQHKRDISVQVAQGWIQSAWKTNRWKPSTHNMSGWVDETTKRHSSTNFL
ncbi:hypothetical protein OPV22_003347 [Ensete ventricosum]|uniref:Uncharacterized protein n=1 Tax=Ensete ventricosum TaxID=4639 RepID=A0AAV8S0B1_ENSVE|nr:hypothetical protein OPV22_003347 [Ensete ventricosum]